MRPISVASHGLLIALGASIPQELSQAKAYAKDCVLAYSDARAVGPLSQQSDPQAKISEFGGEAAAALLRMLAPGDDTQNLKVNRLLVMERPDIDVVRIAVVIGECVVGIGTFDENRWRNWRALTFGAGG